MRKRNLSLVLVLSMLASLAVTMSMTASAKTLEPVATADWNGHTYHVYDESMTWEEAKQYCENAGGHLATITSAEEQNAINSSLYKGSKNGYWLGGVRSSASSFVWINGESMNFTYWDNYQPDNEDNVEDKLMLYNYRGSRLGKWNDLKNEGVKDVVVENMGFICEWDNMNKEKNTSFGSPVSDWAKEEVEEAYDKGLIPEVLVGKDLTEKIDRAEFAAIAVTLYENMSGEKAPASAQNPFNDISGNKCKDDILKAYNLDITTGTSKNTFEPSVNISREQMSAMLTRAYKKSEFDGWSLANDGNYPLNFMGVQKFADDNEISDYAKESVYFMVRWNVINGIGNNMFAPKGNVSLGEAYGFATREQAVCIALRSAKYLK